jgi:hypothetical protein
MVHPPGEKGGVIMDSGLFFLTLAMLCIWLILDEFYGKKRISTFANLVIPA